MGANRDVKKGVSEVIPTHLGKYLIGILWVRDRATMNSRRANKKRNR